MNLSIFFYIKRKSVSQNKNLIKDTCHTSVAILLLYRLYRQWYQIKRNSDKGSNSNSGPQPFWHRGPVCGRQLLPWIGRGGRFQDDSHKKHAHVQFTEGFVLLWESKAAADLTGGRAQVVTPAALNTDETLLAPLLLTSCCVLIYGISADLWPGGWGPLSYNNAKLDINSNTLNLYAPQSINWNIC